MKSAQITHRKEVGITTSNMEETQNKEPEARQAWEFPNDILFHNKNVNDHT